MYHEDPIFASECSATLVKRLSTLYLEIILKNFRLGANGLWLQRIVFLTMSQTNHIKLLCSPFCLAFLTKGISRDQIMPSEFLEMWFPFQWISHSVRSNSKNLWSFQIIFKICNFHDDWLLCVTPALWMSNQIFIFAGSTVSEMYSFILILILPQWIVFWKLDQPRQTMTTSGSWRRTEIHH